MEEAIRFERMVHITMYSGFQIRHNKPLCQASKLIICQNYQQYSTSECTFQLPQQLSFLLLKNNSVCYISCTTFSKSFHSIFVHLTYKYKYNIQKMYCQVFLEKINLTNIKMYVIIRTVIK